MHIFDGNIKRSDFKKLESKVIDLMKVTSQNGKFGYASKKLPKSLSKEISTSIPQVNSDVK